MPRLLSVLALGDVVGQAGLRALVLAVPGLIRNYAADLVIANGENASGGFGLTPENVDQLFSVGIHVVTTGNHVWQQRQVLPVLDREDRLLRPHNYPKGVPGHGHCVLEVKGTKVAVVNLQGRVRMSDVGCPFAAAKDLLKRLRHEARVVIVDFHADDTEEKEALGLYLDGQVAGVVGTHTHVQTADERVLPAGTAYITDLGMVGPSDSVIGFRPQIAIDRALSQMPLKMEVSDNAAFVNGVCIRVDPDNGKATSIERFRTEAFV